MPELIAVAAAGLLLCIARAAGWLRDASPPQPPGDATRALQLSRICATSAEMRDNRQISRTPERGTPRDRS